MNDTNASKDTQRAATALEHTASEDSVYKKRKTAPDPPANSNRKLAQATRTLRACELCRKQKTRCLRSPDNMRSCVRCMLLKKQCSLGPEEVHEAADAMPTTKKLDLIYSGVSEVLAILKSHGGEKYVGDAQLLLETASAMNRNGSLDNALLETPEIDESHQGLQEATNSFKVSPFSIINSQVTDVPRPIQNLLTASAPRTTGQNDLITMGILSMAETKRLMDVFRRNYGRWVSFPLNLGTKTLIERIRHRAPLLLTTCCCLSLRYSLNTASEEDFNAKQETYGHLISYLIKDLNRALLQATSYQGAVSGGDIEFLQAIVILSIYSLSLTSVANSIQSLVVDTDLEDLNLDPWLLSSIGLTTFISKSNFGKLFKMEADGIPHTPYAILYDELDTDEYQTLTKLRIYNHLCLVHLVNCVFSGRMCVIDQLRLNQCSATLSLPSSTNFDGRMVSEINILFIAYNYMQELNTATTAHDYELNYQSVKKEIETWYEQWEYLFSQPALQFVELCYNFCYLLVEFSYNQQKNSTRAAAVFETDTNNIDQVLANSDAASIVLMVEHAHHVVKYVNEIESDDYFAYLSDQLHFMFYYSAIMLVKLVEYVAATNAPVVDRIAPQADIIADLRKLVEKFGRICGDKPGDLITKYRDGLEAMVGVVV